MKRTIGILFAGLLASPLQSSEATRTESVVPASYKVYEILVESRPTRCRHRPRMAARWLSIRRSLASPFGWHDTDGAGGPEFTITRGNNVHAYTDIDANNSRTPAAHPDGGAGAPVRFPARPRPSASEHLSPGGGDQPVLLEQHHPRRLHGYGFDEAAGNFQVQQLRQRRAGQRRRSAPRRRTARAPTTPTSRPRPTACARGCRCSSARFPSPMRRRPSTTGSSTHEYGHGISNRLTGGPANVVVSATPNRWAKAGATSSGSSSPP